MMLPHPLTIGLSLHQMIVGMQRAHCCLRMMQWQVRLSAGWLRHSGRVPACEVWTKVVVEGTLHLCPNSLPASWSRWPQAQWQSPQRVVPPIALQQSTTRLAQEHQASLLCHSALPGLVWRLRQVEQTQAPPMSPPLSPSQSLGSAQWSQCHCAGLLLYPSAVSPAVQRLGPSVFPTTNDRS